VDHYDIGDLARCSAAFTTLAGVAIDPTVLVFRFKNPAGTTTTYTYGTGPQVVKDSTGNYHVDLSTATAGLWLYWFEATGTAQAVEEGSFYVDAKAGATSTALITVAEYEKLVNEEIVGTYPNEYIVAILEAVSQDVRDWCGADFGLLTVTGEKAQAQAVLYNRQPCVRVRVMHSPVTSLTTLKLWYAIDAESTTLAVDDAVIEAGGAAVLVPFGVFGLWTTFFQLGNVYRAEVDYSAGEAVPYNVKRAVALLAQEAFAMDASASREGVDDVESYRLGDYSETKGKRDLAASQGLGLGTQNSILAARTLRKYRSEGVMFL